MQTRFVSSQSVLIEVPDEPVPIQHYLRQSDRLVYALFDPSRIEPLSNDRFRLKMQPFTFLMLNVQPVVDIQVQTTSDGRVSVQSTACEIRGIKYFNQRFNLELAGKLYPRQNCGRTQLEGTADLKVEVELPAILWFTPQQLLETTGNSLLKSILLTIKHRLMHQLPKDYRKWTRSAMAETTPLPQRTTNLPTA